MRCCRRSPAPELHCPAGRLRGSTLRTKLGARICSYRGIPYARPPLGSRRFRRSEPLPEPAWTGTLDCTKEARKSYQPNVLFPDSCLREGGEDCLYLNVYTRHHPSQEPAPAPVPVLVFLHGGAFLVGSCEAVVYGPEVLLDRDLVLVGVNYRLGPLGWLSLDTAEAPGNLGLSDQQLALVWVRDNIAAFGGDPSRVCLAGESAGAMCALLHLASPPSAGLFHSVLALSGCPSSSLLQQDRPGRQYGAALAASLGYAGDQADPAELLAFLQTVPAREIVKKAGLLRDWDVASPMPWVPAPDPHHPVPLLPEPWRQAVQAGRLHRVPVLAGLCRDEGLILAAAFHRDRRQWQLLSEDWKTWAPVLFFGRERELITAADRQAAEDIAKHYWGEAGPLQNVSEKPGLATLARMFTMAVFQAPLAEDIELLAGAGLEVYSVRLACPTNFSLMDIFRLPFHKLCLLLAGRVVGLRPYNQQHGVCHGDDLLYLFPFSVPGFPAGVVTPAQTRTRQALLDCVVSLASSGQPALSDMAWQPGPASFLQLSDQPAIQEADREEEEVELWRRVRAQAGLTGGWSPVDRPVTTLYTKIAVDRR